MPLQKLLQFTKKVSDLADKPNQTMSAAEVKAQFDAAPDEVRQYLNQLIDALQSTKDGDSGADNIKATAITGLTGGTVQTLLENLKALDDSNKEYLLSQIQGVTLGQIPDGTITDAKLSDAEGQIKQSFNAHQADLASQEVNKGASLIGIHDANSLFTSTNVEGALSELFTDVSNGKVQVRDAITGKGGTVADGDGDGIPTFSELSTGINGIPTKKLTNLYSANQTSVFSANRVLRSDGYFYEQSGTSRKKYDKNGTLIETLNNVFPSDIGTAYASPNGIIYKNTNSVSSPTSKINWDGTLLENISDSYPYTYFKSAHFESSAYFRQQGDASTVSLVYRGTVILTSNATSNGTIRAVWIDDVTCIFLHDNGGLQGLIKWQGGSSFTHLITTLQSALFGVRNMI
ncbi:hypothetical protein [Bacillus litorisediminis]|uniref:hypothetical protein n=1 Tax=Bacillus litorisediminis TaxID=2922713 RepID=UPI001FAC1D36|nr:hypothetical protein [Bacillus litorisediminis]